MRLLLVTQHFAPHFEGGTETVVRAAALALQAAGHEVAVLAGRDIPGLDEAALAGGAGREERDARADGGLRVIHVPPRAADGAQPLNDRLMLERPALLDALVAEVRAFAPDLVHVHHFATLSLGLVPALAAAGIPVVVSLHDLFSTCPRFFRVSPVVPACPPPGSLEGCSACIEGESVGVPLAVLEEAFRERRYRFARELDAADLLLAPSQSHARRLEAELEREPGSIAVVESGLVAPLPRLAPPAPLGPGEPLVLVYFGHRARVKGLAELAVAIVETARLGARGLRLTCLGSGLEPELDAVLTATFEAARVEGLDVALELGSSYERRDLPRLVAGAHLAVFPSRAPESYGLVVDEALALGLPVLCAASGALAERLPPGAGQALPAPAPGAAADPRWVAELVALCEQPSRLEEWRAAIPDRIPGPDVLARRLAEHYAPLVH
ncbi:MAG: glycosyltransferase [Planctomycetota bacterium]|nr:glycosyltransferase [Planctomycetota bacterium]